MSLYAFLKQSAKNALQNCWSTAIGVFLIPVLSSALISGIFSYVNNMLFSRMMVFSEIPYVMENPSSIVSLIKVYIADMIIVFLVSLIFSATTFFLFTPLIYGSVRWYFHLVKGTPLPVSSIFHFFESFKRYFRSLGMFINTGIRMTLWKIVYMTIPLVMLSGFSYYFYSRPYISENPAYKLLVTIGFFIVGIIIILSCFFYLTAMNKYFLAPYFFSDSDSIKINESIKKSVSYMKKYRYSLFWFNVSFIGWFILCIIMFPVLFYFVPYYLTAMALYAQYVIETTKREMPEQKPKPMVIGTETARPEIKNELAVEKDANPVWGEDSDLDDLTDFGDLDFKIEDLK